MGCPLWGRTDSDTTEATSQQQQQQVFIELFNFSFLSIIGQGIDLYYCDIEWFALGMNRDHAVIFEIASK